MSDIPADDPRRLLHTGDLEKAYPEHAKAKAAESEMRLVASFLEWLTSRKSIYLCEELEYTDEEARQWREEALEPPPDHRILTHDPWSRAFDRLIAEWQGIDYDALQAELTTMWAVLAQSTAEQEEQ